MKMANMLISNLYMYESVVHKELHRKISKFCNIAYFIFKNTKSNYIITQFYKLKKLCLLSVRYIFSNSVFTAEHESKVTIENQMAKNLRQI